MYFHVFGGAGCQMLVIDYHTYLFIERILKRSRPARQTRVWRIISLITNGTNGIFALIDRFENRSAELQKMNTLNKKNAASLRQRGSDGNDSLFSDKRSWKSEQYKAIFIFLRFCEKWTLQNLPLSDRSQCYLSEQ